MGKLRFLFWHLSTYRRHLILIAAIDIVTSLAVLALPWLAGGLLGQILAGGGEDYTRPAGLLAAALVVAAGCSITGALISQNVSMSILADLRQGAYDKIMGLPLAYHDAGRQGDFLALMTYEVGALSQFLVATLATAPAMLLTAAGAAVLLFLIDPVLAMLLPLALAAFFIVLRLAGRRLRAMASETREAQARILAEAESQLEILPAIRSFAVEPWQRERYAARVEGARRLLTRQLALTAMITPASTLLAALAAIVILLLAGTSPGSASASPEGVLRFLLYAALLTRPIGALAGFYGSFQVASGTLARLRRVMAEEPEPGRDVGVSAGRCRGQITFEAACFTYPGRDAVLNGVNLQIRAGEKIALAGANGAGKSTLAKLLLRFYELDSGRILLDGQDITTLEVRSLRRQFAVVPQECQLFNASIGENVAFAMPAATPQQIAKAIDQAQASEFIAALPDGLDTIIGDRGVRLSGGQRQRIALARALLADPPVLIFDEATAMFDLDSEAAFLASCQQALEGRTVIIITHRQASLALADRVIRIEGGVAREG